MLKYGIVLQNLIPAMVKVESPDSNDGPKEAVSVPKVNDSKFLQPKDVSDVVMYLLTTPHIVNVSKNSVIGIQLESLLALISLA